jgi:ssRNA-specific RNase YbeY (16S rRNA maturation enzyme)
VFQCDYSDVNILSALVRILRKTVHQCMDIGNIYIYTKIAKNAQQNNHKLKAKFKPNTVHYLLEQT